MLTSKNRAGREESFARSKNAGWPTSATSPGRHGRPRCEPLAGGDLALAERGGAAGAEIVEDFFLRQDQEKFFADRHGLLALVAIERRRAEVFELLHGIQE